MVDDGSEDNSLSVCRRYAEMDSRIRVFHFDNHGVSFARNQGLEHAEGKYISFVDSDDYVNNELIEVLLRQMTDNKADLAVVRENSFNVLVNRITYIIKDIAKLLSHIGDLSKYLNGDAFIDE